MTDTSSRTPIEQFLVEGLYSLNYEGWFVPDEPEGQHPQLGRAAAFGLIAEALLQGLMVPGEVRDHVHLPWSCSPPEALARIVTEWLHDWPDEDPTPGAIAWMANTAKGNDVARAVLAREQAAG